jgi:putative tricarboxylic transport membrane protein
MMVIGLATIRWSSLIVKAPRTMMVPGVLVLALIGSYGLSNSLFDVYILVAVGLLGYFLAKLNVPVVTVALGFVLGRMMEETLQQTLLLAQIRTGSVSLYFASRPATIVLMAIAIAIMVAGILQVRRLRTSAEGSDTDTASELPGAAAVADDRGLSMRGANIILAGVVLAVVGVALLGARNMSASAALFPTVAAIALGTFALVLLYGALRAGPSAPMRFRFPFEGVPWPSLLVVMIALVSFTAAIAPLGFYESAFVFAFAVALWLAMQDGEGRLGRNAARALCFAVLLTAGVYLAFDIVLGIPTPSGLFL